MPAPTVLRGVLFDLDDTLLDHRGAAGDALLGWAGRIGLDIALEDISSTWHQLETRYYGMYQRGELSKVEQRRARVRDLLATWALSDAEADIEFDNYWNRYSAAWRAFPDAERAVERALDAGLAVGILTNGDAGDQRRKVEATALARFGLPLFASSDLPAAKPDMRAFKAACAGIDVSPEECLMVGDSLVNDVQGARAAGLSALLLDRQARAGQARPEDGLVRSLDEIRFDA